MELNSVIIIALIVFFILILASRIKSIGENERFAVVTFGKFQKLLRPGLHFKTSGSEVIWLKLSLGQLGKYLGSNIAEFDGVSIPVIFETEPTQGVKISMFKENEIQVSESKVTIFCCEKCGHKNKVTA